MWTEDNRNSVDNSGDDAVCLRKESNCSVESHEVEVIVYNEDGLREREDVKHPRLQIHHLGEKVSRTTNFLQELKTLSASLQEQPMKQEDDDVTKDRQVRRKMVFISKEMALFIKLCARFLKRKRMREKKRPV